MKARPHILFQMWILIAALLFSQVAAGFFHNNHDAHKNTHILAAGKFAIQQHGEHCKLCSIDLIHLYNESEQTSLIEESANSTFVEIIPGDPTAQYALLKGRSPPFIS